MVSNRATSKEWQNLILQQGRSGCLAAPWLRGARSRGCWSNSGEEEVGVQRLSHGRAAADSERQLLS